jgi:threonine/homoserine/homoserine lactone efflux protein
VIGYFVQGIVLGFSASATPGPFMAYLISQSVRNGWRRTLLAAFAPLLSDTPILALVLLVLTQLPTAFLFALKIAGGLFILYLAWGAYASFKRFDAESAAALEPEAGRQNVLQAAVMNLLNPNPYIFWATVGGPILIEGWRLAPILGGIFLIGFYIVLIGGLILLIIVFGTLGQMSPRVSRVLSIASAVLLLAFGGYQLASGIAGLV